MTKPADTSDLAVNAGWTEMNTIITQSSSGSARTDAVAKTLEALADSDLAAADKDKTVAGYVLSVAHSSLTQETKQELVQTVSNTYQPVTTLMDDKIQEDDSVKKLIEADAEHMAQPAPAMAGDTDASAPVVTGVK